MLRQRVITALLMGLPILGILLFAPPVATIVVLAIVMLIGAWEWGGFLRGALLGMRITYVVLIGLLMAFALFSQQVFDTRMLLLLAVIWWVIAAVRIVVLPETELRAFVYVGGVLVLLPMWAALITLTLHHPHGGQLILCLLLLVASTDIGAYFVGRAFGRHKLAPRVSPGKTWEGVAGGLLSSIVIAVLAAYWFDFPLVAFIALSLITAMFSIVGDLTESLFKRHAGLKDSSNILPGHGGILDRIDSITAAAPVFVYGLMYLQLVTL